MTRWMSTSKMVSINGAMTGTSPSSNTSILIAAPRIDLCLDFANTIAWRGSAPEESLHGFADLLEWCVKAGALPKLEAREYRTLLKKNPPLAAEIFGEAIAIREA